jgi:hypothetical protein
MGVKVFRDAARMKGSGGGNFTNERDKIAKLGADGLTLRFVFLNDLPGKEVPEDEQLIQCHMWKWIEGITFNKDKQEKQWSVDIPAGDSDPQQLKDWAEAAGKKQTFQYLSNIFIIKAYKTASGDECELNGDPIGTPWKDKPLRERVRVLVQGNDTSKALFIEGQERRNDGKTNAIAHEVIWNLDRIKGANRTEYNIRKGDTIPGINPEIKDEVMGLRYNILDMLNSMQEFGYQHFLRKWKKDNGQPYKPDGETGSSEPQQEPQPTQDGSNDQHAPDPAIASGDVSIEGTEGADQADFDDIKPEDIAPDTESPQSEFVG